MIKINQVNEILVKLFCSPEQWRYAIDRSRMPSSWSKQFAAHMTSAVKPRLVVNAWGIYCSLFTTMVAFCY